jgi:hypothetical protein
MDGLKISSYFNAISFQVVKNFIGNCFIFPRIAHKNSRHINSPIVCFYSTLSIKPNTKISGVVGWAVVENSTA